MNPRPKGRGFLTINMKNMNRLLNFLFALCASVLLLVCCTPEDDPSSVSGQIKLASNQSKTVTADPAGENVSIRFTSTSEWNASVEDGADWITIIMDASGKAGTSKTTVKVARNESGEKRSAAVNISSGSNSVPVVIEQDVFVPVFELEKDARSVSAKGGSFNIIIQTNSEYSIDADVDWISAVGSKAVSDYRQTFTVEKNTLAESRTGVITFRYGSLSKTFTVTQRPAGTEADDWKVDEFCHRSLALRFTADWCQYCPYMAKAFALAKNSMGDRFEPVSLHGSGSALFFSGTTSLGNRFGISGYPTGIVDGRAFIYNSSQTNVTAEGAMLIAEETQKYYPSTAGIACSSAVNGKNIDVNIDLYIKEAGIYKLVVLLLEDQIIGYQANGGDDYQHDDVAVLAITSVGGETVETAGPEIVSKSYSVKLPTLRGKQQRVLVWVEKSYGDKERVTEVKNNVVEYLNDSRYVDNCRSVLVGETAELELM